MRIEKKVVKLSRLAERLADELSRGARLIERLGDDIYCRQANNSGSVSGHIRHNLDFAESILKGLKTGWIDYGDRERDAAVEENRDYAVCRYDFAIKRLRRLSAETQQSPILVRSESDPAFWHESTVGREIEFVCSHTIHHHALIAEKLAGFGVETERDFGVAPSTLEYWKTKDNDAVAALKTEKLYDINN
jgi:hypothetical protein